MILVTGGTGLVGAHLLYQLSLENDTIVAIHRKSSNIEAVKQVFSYYSDDYKALFKKIQWKIADINDIPSLEKAFENITHVYHVAAIVSFNKKYYRAMRKVNIEGTANMVNLSITNKIEKFCFVSSVAAIGKSNHNAIATEENEWNTEEKNNGYAISKYGAETEVWRGSQEGLAIVIVNPGVILGTGFWKTSTAKLFDVVYNGFKFYTEGVTGYVAVNDVVSIMIQLMNSTIKNERYILVAENRSVKDVLFAIADGFDKKRPPVKVTPFLSEIGWRLEAIKSFIIQKKPLILKETARAGHRKSMYSNEKVKAALDYKFEPLSSSIKAICVTYEKEH